MILRNKLNEFLSHGIIYTLSSAIQASAGFILLPFYGKYLSPSDFGVFSLIQMISVFFSTIFFFGVSTALTRSYYDYQKREERQKVFNTAFLFANNRCLESSCGRTIVFRYYLQYNY